MENFRPDSTRTMPGDAAERLPFDIVRMVIAARQAATPTARAVAGVVDAGTIQADAATPLHLLSGHQGDAGDDGHGARFALCSVGRVVATSQEVSA